MFTVYQDGTNAEQSPEDIPTSQVNSQYGIVTPPQSSEYDNIKTFLQLGFYGSYVEYVDDNNIIINPPALKKVDVVGAPFSATIDQTYTSGNIKYTLVSSEICTTTSQSSGQPDTSTCSQSNAKALARKW